MRKKKVQLVCNDVFVVKKFFWIKNSIPAFLFFLLRFTSSNLNRNRKIPRSTVLLRFVRFVRTKYYLFHLSKQGSDMQLLWIIEIMLMKESIPFHSFGCGLSILLLCIYGIFFWFSDCCVTMVFFFFCKAEL